MCLPLDKALTSRHRAPTLGGMDIQTEFDYVIDYVIAEPDDETEPVRQTLRVQVTDPAPQPGYGPAIAYIHRALREAIREADPDAYAQIEHPDQLVIIKVRDGSQV